MGMRVWYVVLCWALLLPSAFAAKRRAVPLAAGVLDPLQILFRALERDAFEFGIGIRESQAMPVGSYLQLAVNRRLRLQRQV